MTYQTTQTEFAPGHETVTASIDVRHATGESYTGPLTIGYYQDDNSDPGLWLELEGERVQFVTSALPAVIKQLRRAARMAKEDKP